MASARFLGAAIGLALVSVVVFSVCATHFRGNSIKRDYILAVSTIELVMDHVSERGAWPESWSDLERGRRFDSRERQDLLRAARRRVIIDFSASVDELVLQSAAGFTAIRPVRHNELYEDPHLGQVHIASLLAILRDLAKHQNHEGEAAGGGG